VAYRRQTLKKYTKLLENRIRKSIAPSFHSVFDEAAKGRYRHIWLAGGRGSGKSSFVSVMLAGELERRPLANAVVFRKTENTLRDSVTAQIMWALGKLGMDESWSYLASRSAFEEKETGRLILMRGLDNPLRTKGIKPKTGRVELAWFEELSEFRGVDEIRSALASVLRGCETSLCFATFNPPGAPGHWLNRELARNNSSRFVHRSDYLAMPADWLGQSFIAEAEALREQNENLYRRMYLGEATHDEGAVFTNINLRAISGEELAAADRRFNGVDFGFGASPDALIRTAYDVKRKRLFIFDEYWGIREPIETLAKTILDRCGHELVVCDAAEPRMINALTSLRVNARKAAKGPGSVQHGLRWLADRFEIIIDPDACPNAAREFSAYQYVQDRFGNMGETPNGDDHHTIDACRYAMEETAHERYGMIFPRERDY
jgi:PBSX family phage terminase large subunit